jgi:hypothetical protein
VAPAVGVGDSEVVPVAGSHPALPFLCDSVRSKGGHFFPMAREVWTPAENSAMLQVLDIREGTGLSLLKSLHLASEADAPVVVVSETGFHLGGSGVHRTIRSVEMHCARNIGTMSPFRWALPDVRSGGRADITLLTEATWAYEDTPASLSCAGRGLLYDKCPYTASTRSLFFKHWRDYHCDDGTPMIGKI